MADRHHATPFDRVEQYRDAALERRRAEREQSHVTEPNEAVRRHKLLPADVRRSLPAVHATNGRGMDAVARVKFFATTSRYTLYVVEFDQVDLLYGWCVSALGPDCDEWGYTSFLELAEPSWPAGVPMIERDCRWTPVSISEAIAGA